MADNALFLGMAWRFQQAYYKHIKDTWDWQWYFAILSNSGMAIVPAVNLVANIGFDPKATHTKSRQPRGVNRKTYSLEFPLLHPDVVAPNLNYHREITKVRPIQEFIFKIKAKLRPYKNYLLNFIKYKSI